MKVNLNVESHTYTDTAGLSVPGCSTVIAGLQQYIGVPVDVLEYAAERGRKVHHETAIMDILEARHTTAPGWMILEAAKRGDEYDYGELDPEIMAYVYAWETFKSDAGFEPTDIEDIVSSKRHRCAGQLDRAGWCHRLFHEKCIIDLKAVAALQPATGVQLAGYRLMYNEERPKEQRATKRLAVQLLPDATYRVKEYKGSNDQAVFLSALSLHNWRLEHERDYNPGAD